MAWTAEKVRALRESNPSETAKKDEKSGKWTAERVRALRTSTPSQPADAADGAGGWTKGNAAALRAQKQTEAANADLRLRRLTNTGQTIIWGLRTRWTAGGTG